MRGHEQRQRARGAESRFYGKGLRITGVSLRNKYNQGTYIHSLSNLSKCVPKCSHGRVRPFGYFHKKMRARIETIDKSE